MNTESCALAQALEDEQEESFIQKLCTPAGMVGFIVVLCFAVCFMQYVEVRDRITRAL